MDKYSNLPNPGKPLLSALAAVAIAVVALQVSAVVTGLQALSDLGLETTRQQGKGLAVVGLTLGSVGLVLDVPLYAFVDFALVTAVYCQGGC